VDDQDCSDFSSQAAAQQHLRDDPSDPDHLDPDHNGIACESNSSPYDTVPVSEGGTATTTARTTTTTTIATTVQRTTDTTAPGSPLATSGPDPWVWLVGVAGAMVLLAGTSMRGRRADGVHWR
jgi:hypothetical protein